MFTLTENGDVYAPEVLGPASVLLAAGKIAKIGTVDGTKLAALGVECEVIDAGGCYVVPGLIDPPQHILVEGAGSRVGSRGVE